MSQESAADIEIARASAPSPGSAREKMTFPWREPEFGKLVQVADNIYWLSTPLPFRLRAINSYLIEEEDGWTVIDCGFASDTVREHWKRIWQDHFKGKPLSRVIVTHFHPDHMGNAAWFHEVWGVRPQMAETEWAFANLAVKALNTDDVGRRIALYRSHGASEELVEQFLTGSSRYTVGCPSIPATYTRLREGDVIVMNGTEWQVLIGHGHSPEHVCLYSDELAIMIAGDQILPEITPNISAWHFEPDANPLKDFMGTIGRFRPLLREDTLILPAHRRPFQGARRRFDELEHHHHLRLEKIIAATGPAGITSAALMPLIFPGNLDGHQIGFGMHEALAHLNFLMHEGKMIRKLGADGVVRYYKS